MIQAPTVNDAQAQCALVELPSAVPEVVSIGLSDGTQGHLIVRTMRVVDDRFTEQSAASFVKANGGWGSWKTAIWVRAQGGYIVVRSWLNQNALTPALLAELLQNAKSCSWRRPLLPGEPAYGSTSTMTTEPCQESERVDSDIVSVSSRQIHHSMGLYGPISAHKTMSLHDLALGRGSRNSKRGPAIVLHPRQGAGGLSCGGFAPREMVAEPLHQGREEVPVLSTACQDLAIQAEIGQLGAQVEGRRQSEACIISCTQAVPQQGQQTAAEMNRAAEAEPTAALLPISPAVSQYFSTEATEHTAGQECAAAAQLAPAAGSPSSGTHTEAHMHTEAQSREVTRTNRCTAISEAQRNSVAAAATQVAAVAGVPGSVTCMDARGGRSTEPKRCSAVSLALSEPNSGVAAAATQLAAAAGVPCCVTHSEVQSAKSTGPAQCTAVGVVRNESAIGPPLPAMERPLEEPVPGSAESVASVPTCPLSVSEVISRFLAARPAEPQTVPGAAAEHSSFQQLGMPEPALKASGKAASLLSLPCLQQLVVPSTWRRGAAHAAPREQQPVNRSSTLYPPTCPRTQSPTATADRSAAGLSLFSLVAHDSSHHGSQNRAVKSGMAGKQPGEAPEDPNQGAVGFGLLSLIAHSLDHRDGSSPAADNGRTDAQPGEMREGAQQGSAEASAHPLTVHASSHHGSLALAEESERADAQPGEVLRGTDVFSAAPVRGSFLSLLAHGPPIYRGPEPTVKGVRVDAQPGQLHEDAAHEPAWRACLLSLLAADLNSSVHQGGPATGPQTQLHAACQAGPTALEKVERLLAELDSDMQELPDQTALGEAGMQLQDVASTARERLAWLPAVKSNSTSPRAGDQATAHTTKYVRPAAQAECGGAATMPSSMSTVLEPTASSLAESPGTSARTGKRKQLQGTPSDEATLRRMLSKRFKGLSEAKAEVAQIRAEMDRRMAQLSAEKDAADARYNALLEAKAAEFRLELRRVSTAQAEELSKVQRTAAQIVQEALREKQAASAWRCAAEKRLQDRAELLAAAGRELAALQARVGPLSRELSKWKEQMDSVHTRIRLDVMQEILAETD